MKKILLTSMFMLAMFAWAAAQQPSGTQDQGGGQTGSPSTQSPSQTQPPASGSSQNGSGGVAADAPVTEGCLGGSDPNYTITDKAGTTYKLNIPANKDTSKLAAHVGESVQVAGNVNKSGTASIDVQGIGRGMGTCSGNGSKGAQQPPPSR